MTEHRHLKRLVRERVDRTGEAYTTALLHVRAHGPADSDSADTSAPSTDAALTPAAHEPGPPPMTAPAQHRLSALTRTMLAAAGLPVSEPMACGLGGGIGFLYAIFEYKKVDHPLLTIVAQHHPQPWLEAVAQHLNSATATVDRREVTSSSARAALTKLDSTLETSPAWITVGRGGLPWHELPDGPLAEAEAADPYPVVVTRDEQPGSAEQPGSPERPGSYVVDDADGVRHTLSADELSAAWSLHKKGKFAIETLALVGAGGRAGGGGSAGFHSEVVEGASTAPSAAHLEVTADAVRASVATTVAHLTGPVIHHAFDTNFGLSGMRKLAAELRDDRTKAGWRRRFGDERAFGVGMLRLAECLTWAHTAPGGTRPLFAEFLREAAELLPSGERDSWREAATAADAAGASWTQIADTAGAAAAENSGADPATTFDALAALVEQAIEHEERMVELLD